MSRLTVPVSDTDHVLGPPLALVTLLEYGDYECPHCGRAHRDVKAILRDMQERVGFAFRHFALDEVHPHAVMAAQAAEAAGAQGRFWEMHDTLFSNQDALENADLLSYAESMSLDVERFAQELADGTYLDKVRGDLRSGVRSGVDGTPTFYINNHRHDGSWDFESLSAAIAEAMVQVAASPHW